MKKPLTVNKSHTLFPISYISCISTEYILNLITESFRILLQNVVHKYCCRDHFTWKSPPIDHTMALVAVGYSLSSVSLVLGLSKILQAQRNKDSQSKVADRPS